MMTISKFHLFSEKKEAARNEWDTDFGTEIGIDLLLHGFHTSTRRRLEIKYYWENSFKSWTCFSEKTTVWENNSFPEKRKLNYLELAWKSLSCPKSMASLSYVSNDSFRCWWSLPNVYQSELVSGNCTQLILCSKHSMRKNRSNNSTKFYSSGNSDRHWSKTANNRCGIVEIEQCITTVNICFDRTVTSWEVQGHHLRFWCFFFVLIE